MNTTTNTELRQSFDRNISFYARDLATREITGTSAWVIGLEIGSVANSFDISNLTRDFLINELKLRQSHFFLDAHNWSDFYRCLRNIEIQIIESLVAKKDKVGA